MEAQYELFVARLLENVKAYTEDLLPVGILLLVFSFAEFLISRLLGYRASRTHSMLKILFCAYLLILFQMTVSLQSLWFNLKDGTLSFEGGIMITPLQEIRNIWFYGSVEEIIRNLAGNFLAFIPMGLLPPLLWRKFRRLRLALLWVAIPTLVIEGLQLFTPRTTSVDDLILNAAGAFLGYFIFMILHFAGVDRNTALVEKRGRHELSPEE